MIFNNQMSEKQFFYKEICEWLSSRKRGLMLKAEAYLDGHHDIEQTKRMVIGENGELTEIKNLPNNHVVDNQFERMVSQKTNYLFSNELVIKTEDPEYHKLLVLYFNRLFHLKMQTLGLEAILGGIAYIYVYYDQAGELDFDVFMPYEGIPYWSDSIHTKMSHFVRVFNVQAYEGNQKVGITKAEVFKEDGIHRYTLVKDNMIADFDNPMSSYIVQHDEESDQDVSYNWERFPVIAFKYNAREIPLLQKVKSLQDGINTMLSAFQNGMDEDVHKTILVLVNYDGQNLGEFRKNLATYGAVKVRSSDGVQGDVKTLQVEVNNENYQAIIRIFKQALIENAHGYDAKDDRLSGSPNEMNLRSMYSDLDLDANGMETQFQASLEQLLWFINQDLINKGKGDYRNEKVQFVFNRDIMVNVGENIANCRNSMGLVSNKTILANHPFVTNVDDELEAVKQEKLQNMEDFGLPARGQEIDSTQEEDEDE